MVSPERQSNLRVLIHSPYPVGKGDRPSGVSVFIEEIVPHLVKLGCEMKTIGPANKDRKTGADYNLGRTISLSAIGTQTDAAITFDKRRARDILVEAKPHIIISHEPAVPNSSHTLFSAIPKDKNERRIVPVIGQFHAGYPPGGLDAMAKFYTVLARLIRRPKFKFGIPTGLTMGYVNTIEKTLSGRIAVSHGTAEFWNEMFPGDYRVIYNGIDVNVFTPDGPKFKKWNDGRKTIFFAGRHDKRKGLEYLLEAYDLLRRAGFNLKFKIAGEGHVTERLREQVRKREIPDVEFLGILSKDDLIKAYRSADLVVAPSIGGEGFNRTIAEARSCGTLVVCTDIKGQNEAIGDDLYDFMAKPSDSDSLARAINKILNLPEETARELRIKSGRDARERFSWEVIADQHVRYYDEVLTKYGGRPKWGQKEGSRLGRLPLAGDVFVSDK